MSGPIRPDQVRTIGALADESARTAAAILVHCREIRTSFGASANAEDLVVLNGLELAFLTQHDTSALTADMVRHTGTLRGHMYARLLQLTIHESARTLRSLLARTFRERIVAVLGEPALDAKLREAHSLVSRLFDESDRRFGALRNGLGAHRDSDANTRHLLLYEIGEPEIVELVFMNWDVFQCLSVPTVAYVKYLREITSASITT